LHNKNLQVQKENQYSQITVQESQQFQFVF
jgi:hypothetical protein